MLNKIISFIRTLPKLFLVQLAAAILFMRLNPERGALVTSDFLAGLLTNFRAIFNQELADLDKEQGLYKNICTIFPSTTDKETYGWLGAVPAMSEWKDHRKIGGLYEYDYTLKNRDFESTIEVDRNTIEDDKYSLIAPRIKSLAMRCVRFFNQKVFSHLNGAHATYKAYDGNYLTLNSHAAIGDSGTFTNYLSEDYVSATDKILAGLDAAVAAMRKFKDDKGVLMNLVPDSIVCPPELEMLIQTALFPPVANEVRPELAFFPRSRIWTSPWLTGAKDFFCLCTRAEVAPVILQMRKDPEIVSLDDPKSEHVFMNRTFLYGVDTRFEVGFGDPRTVVQVHGTV